MNALEDRIRAATRAAADTVPPDSVPPMRHPAEASPGNGVARLSWWHGWRSWGSWTRRLAPLAAAATVVVVAVTMMLVGRAHQQAPTAASPASQPSGLTAPLAGPDGVPPYYVKLEASGNPNFVPSYAVIRSTVSGDPLGVIKPSVPRGTILAATAAADDRTFVLDEEKFASTTSNVNGATETRSFYLLRLSTAGKPTGLTRLNVTVSGLLTGFALSPDGTRLAVAVQPQQHSNANLEELRIYTLATGAVRTWTGEGVIGSSGDDALSLSWTGDGKRLLFDWEPATASSGAGAGLGPWLLDTTLPGTGLVADSRQAASSSSASGLTCQQDEIISPDGSVVTCGALNTSISGSARDVAIAFLQFSVRTGHLTRTRFSRTIDHAGPLNINVLWSDASGSVLIVGIPDSGNGKAGILRGNTFTPLDIPGLQDSAFAGTW